MFIIWGETVVRRKQGYTLRFCPICRDVRAVKIVEVAKKQHIYYVPLGKRAPVLTEMTCTDCDSIFAEDLYRGTRSDEPATNPRVALAQLFPAEADPIKARIKEHERVMSASATADERMAAASEPYFALAYEFEVAAQSGSEASISALISAGALLGVILSIVLWMIALDSRQLNAMHAWAIGVTFATMLFCFASVYRNSTRGRRLMSKRFLRRIVRSLKAMKATAADYHPPHLMLSRGKHPVASALTTEQLVRAMEDRGMVV